MRKLTILLLGPLVGALGCHAPQRRAPASSPVAAVPVPAPAPAPAPEPVPPPVAATPVDDGSPVDVSLRVEARTAKGVNTLASGQTLRSGDELALYVSAAEPAYVYVALASADGERNLLTAEPLKPETERRIPEAGKWFRLDKETGHEDIFLYASRREVPKADVLARLAADAEKAKSERRKAQAATKKPKEPKKPSGNVAKSDVNASAETRGLEVVDEAVTDVDRGITRKHFTIKHAR